MGLGETLPPGSEAQRRLSSTLLPLLWPRGLDDQSHFVQLDVLYSVLRHREAAHNIYYSTIRRPTYVSSAVLRVPSSRRKIVQELAGTVQNAASQGSGGDLKQGAWRGSGVAAMRAAHEAEVTALKEEKQDLLMKYQNSAAKTREQGQRCAELMEEVRNLQGQLKKLQVRLEEK